MVAASFGYPGDYGGLSPLWYRDETGWHLDLTAENYLRFASDWIYAQIFLKSLVYATVTTVACLLLGYPLALLIARSPARRRNFLLFLVILPFWSNFLIRIYAWMIILGPQAALSRLVNSYLEFFGAGPVSLLFGPFAVILGLTYVFLPFMILPLYANLEKHDPAWLDAAQDLGAGAAQRFFRVTWPLSRPGVYAGSLLVFIPAFGNFAVPDILGGTEGIMIGNVISTQFLAARDWPFGAVLSIALTLAVLLLAGLAVLASRPRGAMPEAARV